jgi:hypothetical protein
MPFQTKGLINLHIKQFFQKTTYYLKKFTNLHFKNHSSEIYLCDIPQNKVFWKFNLEFFLPFMAIPNFEFVNCNKLL